MKERKKEKSTDRQRIRQIDREFEESKTSITSVNVLESLDGNTIVSEKKRV